MKLYSALWLSCGLLVLPATAQETASLAEIEAQISSYQRDHGLTAAGGTAAGPPLKCSLAVSPIKFASERLLTNLPCAFLDFTLPGRIGFPGSPVYQTEGANYWSLQQVASTPVCRFSPTTAADVSIGVLSLRVSKCKFAVKSGGHGAFSGASNINGGVTVDLKNLNQITLSRDQKVTLVGAGNTWHRVYNYLDPRGLTVVGGRVSDIGVGGLTLGGGISFFSGRNGWACDNVNNYQVVFADGQIRDVNFRAYSDLYWALRGGGNNFGIVTRVDLATFSQGDFWAGSNTYRYTPELAERFNSAFHWLNVNADPFAAIIMVYVYVQAANMYAIVIDSQYTKPEANPATFKNFTSMPTSAQLANTTRITNMTAAAAELSISNPYGFRNSYWTLTVKTSPTLITDITAIYMDEVNKVKLVPDLIPSLVLQPITTAISSHFRKNGGNALGFDDRDGPLTLLQLSLSWSGIQNDDSVMAMARTVIARSNNTAHAQNLGHPFLYQNYAAAEQNVFFSYGAQNLERLRDVSRKYDPARVWHDLQPGYFKIF